MTASIKLAVRLQRMIDEVEGSSPYDTTSLQRRLADWPVRDQFGSEPQVWDTTKSPPVATANTAWVPTYDLNALAAEIWTEKAAAWIDKYDFSADGSSSERSQVYEQMMQHARRYRKQRVPGAIRINAGD